LHSGGRVTHQREHATRAGPTAAAALALVGFAANSLLTRAALGAGLIDAASFTLYRLASGAVALVILVRLAGGSSTPTRQAFAPAIALFVYAAAFSYAYLRIEAGVGALILFGCVQLTMVGWGVASGDRPRAVEWLGLALACAGLVVLQAPGKTAPDWAGAALMAVAGVAWAVYSLFGREVRDPLGATAQNFAVSVALALMLSAGAIGSASSTREGIGLAVVSGALASGVGYALWYRALPSLTALEAAIAQLVVPVLAAAGAAMWLNESPSARLVVSGAMVVCGIAMVVTSRVRALEGASVRRA
jgi:drug/metabolite transporter (DMT)-like permease